MKRERPSNEQPHIPEKDGINLLSVYRSMLRIVARLEESEYTESNSLLRQTEVYHHPDLADPASDEVTLQG
ncbi:MAG TPA: hypothetical protein VHL11_24500 [Phototrophicaceae bacterium]|nr:hypothetical protein [Phototrophicaceae bacterium]